MWLRVSGKKNPKNCKLPYFGRKLEILIYLIRRVFNNRIFTQWTRQQHTNLFKKTSVPIGSSDNLFIKKSFNDQKPSLSVEQYSPQNDGRFASFVVRQSTQKKSIHTSPLCVSLHKKVNTHVAEGYQSSNFGTARLNAKGRLCFKKHLSSRYHACNT